MRTKAQLIKTASTLKDFSGKIKSAQMGETLTPEAVQEIALEIADVAEVAAELASEIAENVPAEGGNGIMDELRGENSEESTEGIGQIETAQDDDMKDDEKEDLKEKLASLTSDLTKIKREATLAKLAPKYASLFPKELHEAKMNEILNSQQTLQIVEAKIQEASDIITNKTMIKVASMSNSIFDIGNSSDSEEVNIAAKL